VVVEQDGQVVGILTERDVMHAAAELGDVGQAQVADHMTAPVVTASPNWDVGVAAAEMHDRRIRHLVVLEQGRRPACSRSATSCRSSSPSGCISRRRSPTSTRPRFTPGS
jgi:CBS domain-containing protein